MSGQRSPRVVVFGVVTIIVLLAASADRACCGQVDDRQAEQLRSQLDFPILFAKRPNYQGIHIYDTCYQWHPGGGIYVLENPADLPEEHRVRAVIDPTTPETLGDGVYFDPELSYDASRILFSFKGEPDGSSSIYEIGLDGSGLRQVTDPGYRCVDYHGSHGGVHDLMPTYLPDERIAFTSTRFNGLVPCANKGVAILHVMDADGSDIHPISVNSETEFDPWVLEDGRILFGRWEYIDKTALTQQSLWTVFPDGTNETAAYANNMVFPEAILDARQVPGVRHLLCGSFTPHNSTPRGTIAMIDTRLGKNNPAAIFNFDTPDDPTNNRGNSCEPWPLDERTVLYSTMVDEKNVLMLAHRNTDDTVSRTIVYRDEIDCHTPIPLRARPLPRLRPEIADRSKTTGVLSVHDVYQGMPEVPHGSIKELRVIEETSRISPSPGSSIYNQTFSVSAALAFACKNYLGVVPVEEDGSALFEVPAGKAIYLQALDAEGRVVRSMRSFIQAAPGTTRSCVGCHEDKQASFQVDEMTSLAQRHPPRQLEEESWGSGPMDYASMVQPILDKNCVTCHGGENGVACGLDLTGGWTDFFSISYENLTSRREVQYKSTLIAGIDCMNGTALYSSQILPAYSHGSTAAPLAKVLVEGDRGHAGRLDEMTRTERDLLLAWIDSNGLYNGTWDYTEQGCRMDGWQETKAELIGQMKAIGCSECHDTARFEADWFNLQRPELSRILRAPLAKDADGYGLGLCREREVKADFRRLRIMSTGRYQHAVMPLEDFPRQEWQPWDESGEPVVSLASTDDPGYAAMMGVIQRGRGRALAAPRVDMPGAMPIGGESRSIYPIPIPDRLPSVAARQLPGGEVELSWPRNVYTWGLTFNVYRGTTPEFVIDKTSRIATTVLCRHLDLDDLPLGETYYAIVMDNGEQRSEPIRAMVHVGPISPPGKVVSLTATPGPGKVRLTWQPLELRGVKYLVSAAETGSDDFRPLGDGPSSAVECVDFVSAAVMAAGAANETLPTKRYRVRAVNRKGVRGPESRIVEAAPKYVTMDPVFQMGVDSPDGMLLDGSRLKATLDGPAMYADGGFDFTTGGHAAYANDAAFQLGQGPGLTVECSVCFTGKADIPVVIGAGQWSKPGWFLQQIGGRWRWYVGGVSCDGGKAPKLGEWTHLRAVWDGSRAKLYQDTQLVADVACPADLTPWTGPFVIGQYSGGIGPRYQVLGRVKDVKVYARAVE